MRILIVGAGVVGSNLAQELSAGGHDVSIVDNHAAVIRQLRERMDVLAVHGNGAQPSVLQQAGIDSAEMVIAVTNVDEVNLVICMIARKYGVRVKIARVRNEEYCADDAALQPSDFGVDTLINPESIITTNLHRVLEIPGANEVASFADGQVLLVTLDVKSDAPIVGRRLAELRDLTSHSGKFRIVAIFRGDSALVPRGDDQINAGDRISIVARADDLSVVLPLAQQQSRPTKRIVIYGGSLVGRRIAALLQHQLERVVLIEPSEELAEELAATLDKTLVLQGEARDPDLLIEADIQHCDVFLALSRDDESNLLAALMARRHGARRLVVSALEPHYVPILNNIGMDVVVNPRLVAVSEILHYVRAGHVHVVRRLHESEAEVMELDAMVGAPITRKPLKKIEFPSGAIIGAVMREGKMLIPDGDTQIAAGETIVVFALSTAVENIGKLCSRKALL